MSAWQNIKAKQSAAESAWLKSIGAKQRAVAEELKSEFTWLSSSEAKQRADAGKAYAFSEFKKRFPSADESRFQVQVEFDSNRKATGEVFFTEREMAH